MTRRGWQRTFLIIWAGQAFSLLGSSAAQFVVLWWLAVETGSAAVLATASLAMFLPGAILGPFAGVWVDRLPRKAVLIGADLFIAAGSAVLAAAFLAGAAPVWLIYAILLQRACGATFHAPALQAATPMLVPEAELVRTGGWSQFLTSGSFMLGPVLGAALYAGASIPVVMAIDIAGALLAVAALALVEIPDPPRRAGAAPSVLGELRAGLAAIRANRALVALTVPVLLTTLFYVPVSALFPLMVSDHFGGTAWHASVVELVFAGGMLASSLVLGVWGGPRDRFLLINLALGALGATLVAAGLLPPSGFVAFAALCALMGLTGSFFSVPYMAFVQATVAPEALGRVMALLGSLMSLAIPAGLVIAGPAARATGVPAWFAGSGAAIVLAALLGHILTRRVPTEPLAGVAATTTHEVSER